MSNVIVFDHPLIQHKVGVIRRTETGSKDFRTIVGEIAKLMCFEATRDLKLKDVEVQAPLQKITTPVLAEDFTIVPILRAGLGMVDGLRSLSPTAKVGHVGLYRDEETLQPVEYYCKLPKDIERRYVYVVDPMLATGGSAIDAITQIKLRNPKKIIFMCIIAAPEGLQALQEAHPDVDIYCAAMDDHLNENGYIVPGLGDAGDRIFGTK